MRALTSEVSEVGLLTEVEDCENGRDLLAVSVGVRLCSSMRRISSIGSTATPPIGLRDWNLVDFS